MSLNFHGLRGGGMGIMCFLPEVSKDKDSSSIKVIDFGLAELFEPDQKALFFF